MMRPSSLVLVSLLALSLLTGAQGIRLKIGLLSFGHDQPAQNHELNKMMKTSHEEDGSVAVGQSIAGMNRKLITTTTTSEINEKNEESKANPRSSSKSKSIDHGESNLGTNNSPPTSSSDEHSSYDGISQDHYHVDITDITEMDYSPARRKPPIHN